MFRDIEVVGNDLVIRHSVAAPTLKIAQHDRRGQLSPGIAGGTDRTSSVGEVPWRTVPPAVLDVHGRTRFGQAG